MLDHQDDDKGDEPEAARPNRPPIASKPGEIYISPTSFVSDTLRTKCIVSPTKLAIPRGGRGSLTTMNPKS